MHENEEMLKAMEKKSEKTYIEEMCALWQNEWGGREKGNLVKNNKNDAKRSMLRMETQPSELCGRETT